MDDEIRQTIDKVISNSPFVPLDDGVIVYHMKLSQTAGGIMLPDREDHKASRGFARAGIVVAVGPGRFVESTGQRVPINVQPRDTIIFSAQAGLELGEVVRKEVGPEFAWEEIRLMRAHDIIAKLKNDIMSPPKKKTSFF